MKKLFLLAAVVCCLAGNAFASLTEGMKSDTKLKVTTATTDRAVHSGEEISKAYDGDVNTLFHSNWNGVASPATLVFTIEPGRLDYLIYVPRPSGNNGIFKLTEISTKAVGSGTFVLKETITFSESNSPMMVEINEDNVEQVKFVVKTCYGTAFFPSCAEMEFYRKAENAYDLLTLFTDLSCSALKPSITQDDINACPIPVYRDIATQLLAGTYKSEFRIGSFQGYPDPSVDATRNYTAKYGVMDNPTGIAVSAGDTLLVFVDSIQPGFPVALKIQTLTLSNSSIGYNAGPEFPLKNGLNIIPVGTLNGVTTGGLGYIRYYYSGTTAPKPIKVNFYGGTVNGYFDSNKHTNADWTRLRQAATNTFFDLKGKYAVLTAPRTYLNSYASTRGLTLINIYDEIVRLEWKFMGLLPDPEGFGGAHRSRAYFVYMAMPSGVGANASDYRTAYPDPRIADPAYILNENGSHRDFIWVFGHEHGHVNQTRPGFRWAGMTEVTNNIHSLYVQTHIKETFPSSQNTPTNTRLQKESMRNDGGYVNRYEKAFNRYFAAGSTANAQPLPHNTSDMDVFCKLVPFWQLELYLSQALEKNGTHGISFYEDLYDWYRKNMPNSSVSAGQLQLTFVEAVCKLANLNLEDFFRRWGFLTTCNFSLDDYGTGTINITQAMVNTTLRKIREYPSPEPMAAEYITDANVSVFKNKSALGTGGVASMTGNKFNARPTGYANAVAFEVRADSATGKIKYVFVPDASTVNQDFTCQGLSFDPSRDHLYAVSYSGERREITVNWVSGPVAPTLSTATEPVWYFVQNCRNSKLLTYMDETTNVYTKSKSASLEEQQLWRFEGTTAGFRIISKVDNRELKKTTLTEGVRFMPVTTGTGDAVFQFETSSNTQYGTDKWAIRYDSSNGLNAHGTNEPEVTTYGISDAGSVWQFSLYSLPTGIESPATSSQTGTIRYYTLQGIEVLAPQSGHLYIVKKTNNSNHLEITKQVYQ